MMFGLRNVVSGRWRHLGTTITLQRLFVCMGCTPLMAKQTDKTITAWKPSLSKDDSPLVREVSLTHMAISADVKTPLLGDPPAAQQAAPEVYYGASSSSAPSRAFEGPPLPEPDSVLDEVHVSLNSARQHHDCSTSNTRLTRPAEQASTHPFTAPFTDAERRAAARAKQEEDRVRKENMNAVYKNHEDHVSLRTAERTGAESDRRGLWIDKSVLGSAASPAPLVVLPTVGAQKVGSEIGSKAAGRDTKGNVGGSPSDTSAYTIGEYRSVYEEGGYKIQEYKSMYDT